MANMQTQKLLATAVAAAEDKQAVDLTILELDPNESGLTDYFLVMSGTNSRQVQTLADEIELQLKRQHGDYAKSREGYQQAEWILLDYVDFVVHIFSQEKRAFYDIERLRKSATSVTPQQLRAALVAKTSKAREKAAGSESASRKAASKTAVGKKTAGTRKVAGVPTGAKSVGPKGLAKKSAKKAGKAPAKKAANKTAGKASKPIARGKNKLKKTPKSTPKSRKRS